MKNFVRRTSVFFVAALLACSMSTMAAEKDVSGTSMTETEASTQEKSSSNQSGSTSSTQEKSTTTKPESTSSSTEKSDEKPVAPSSSTQVKPADKQFDSIDAESGATDKNSENKKPGKRGGKVRGKSVISPRDGSATEMPERSADKAGVSQGTEINTEKPEIASDTSRGESNSTEKPEIASGTSRGDSSNIEKPEKDPDQAGTSRGTQSSNGTEKKNSLPSDDTAA